MAFQGWLVKFGDIILPNHYLEGYEDDPNKRTELDSYRDSATLMLYRTTSPYYKSQITLPIRRLYYGEKIFLKSIIDAAMLNETERKVAVTYWNDEEMDYKSGEFYIADIKYTITHIDAIKLNMVYKPFSIILTEY